MPINAAGSPEQTLKTGSDYTNTVVAAKHATSKCVRRDAVHSSTKAVPSCRELPAADCNNIVHARHNLDREFLYDNPDYSKLISTIDTTGFNWLNFDMKRDEQIRLFRRGAEAAASFLLGCAASVGGHTLLLPLYAVNC